MKIKINLYIAGSGLNHVHPVNKLLITSHIRAYREEAYARYCNKVIPFFFFELYLAMYAQNAVRDRLAKRRRK